MRARWATALVVAACVTRTPENHAFRIAATIGGNPVEAGITEGTALVYDGTAKRVDDTTLEVTLDGSTSVLRVTFQRDGAPKLAFPPQLDGQHVGVTLDVQPTHSGPDGEPLALHGLLVATGTPPLAYQLVIGEFSSDDPRGVQIRPSAPNEDVPWFQSVSDWAQFEPSSCGPVYYDALRVVGAGGDGVTLRTGETGHVASTTAGLPSWTAMNVVGWHRSDGCGGKPKSWTQLAAWR